MPLQENKASEAAAEASRTDRRTFLANSSTLAALPMVKAAMATSGASVPAMASGTAAAQAVTPKSIIGSYGAWAATLAADPPVLSLRSGGWDDLDVWRRQARAKVLELLAPPSIQIKPQVNIVDQYAFDGLEVQELTWQLPYGRPTAAVLLKPTGVRGRLPAVLGLHDHGGNKYFGHRKITRTSESQHPLIRDHQRDYYGGRAWANELARRGYVVLVHDTYTFASRRVLFEDMQEIPWGEASTRGRSDDDPEQVDNIRAYNEWAAAHEHVMAKSLFCAGTTWPGVFLVEDQQALDVLCARDDVDADRVGCAGLSGGGLRTVYLGGLDPRIKCAVCIGFLSTWRDFLLNKTYTHTWMTYTPLLPKFLDFPEILGLRVPLPTMTQSCTEDSLYTLPEMRAADRQLQDVFAQADSSDHYQGRFYAGGHKFDEPMQRDAFAWLDRWLQPA